LALARELGGPWRGEAALAALGALAVDRGDDAAARRLYREALALQRVSEFGASRYAGAAILDELGALAEAAGEYVEAAARYREALALRRVPNSGLDPAESLERFAGLAASRGDVARAIRLAAAHTALLRPPRWLPFGIERIRPRRTAPLPRVAAATRQCAAAMRAAAEGRAMSLEQALAYALDSSDAPQEVGRHTFHRAIR
jgi:hypothetical protein